MKERLIIKNFGPIKEVDLEIRRFNVIIGDNGTGKSTIAKVLAICRYFTYLLKKEYSFFSHFEQGLADWGLDNSEKDGSYIEYICEDYKFIADGSLENEYDHETGEIDGVNFNWNTILEPKSDQFIKLLEEYNRQKEDANIQNEYGLFADDLWTPPSSFFEGNVKAVMDNPFFLRTERGLQSVFSLGKSGVRNLSDSLFNHLAELDSISRSFKNFFEIDFLNIRYKNENGVSFFYDNKTEDRYKLQNGPSGYQSSIPIILSIEYYIRREFRKRTYIIEEPELNLYPKTQYELMMYLVDRTINYGNKMLLTTHSPYIITTLNNLIAAYNAGMTDKVATEKIIAKDYWINPEDVAAYRLLTDGTMENIIDREEGVVMADKLDEISELINGDYSKLLNIEFGSNEE